MVKRTATGCNSPKMGRLQGEISGAFFMLKRRNTQKHVDTCRYMA